MPRINPSNVEVRTLQALRVTAASGPPFAASFLAELSADHRAGAEQLHRRCVAAQARYEAEAARAHAMLHHERTAWEIGHALVAGVDEAGRGPLAGPIVAAAVILRDPPHGLNDSKQLTASKREALYAALMEGNHAIGVGVVSAADIDRIGIQSANYGAMLLATEKLPSKPDLLLVDGFALPTCPCPQRRLIKGDCVSLSIAAASIIAKVTRDRLMLELSVQYPAYGFDRNKGYGTPDHLAAIAHHGPCQEHRRSFTVGTQAAQTPLPFTKTG